MRVTLTGATGFVGSRLVAALQARGDDVTALSRDAGRAREQLAVRDSREIGTRRLVTGIAAADPRPRRLVCAGELGYEFAFPDIDGALANVLER